MKDLLIKFAKFIFAIISFFASIITILNWKKFNAILRESENFQSAIKPIYSSILSEMLTYPFHSTLFIILFLSIIIVKNNLTLRGANGNGISLFVFLRRFNPIRLMNIILEFHEFQHGIQNAIQIVHSQKNRQEFLSSTEAHRLTYNILLRCKQIIEIFLGVPISIHIKLFKAENEGEILLTDAKLVPYERVPSNVEFLKREKGKLRMRSKDEQFKIFLKQAGTVESLKRIVATENNLEYSVNSVYNYIFGQNEHFWISNNLKIDFKKGLFFSTSHEYEKFYNSLAVFLISPPLSPGAFVSYKEPKGLLIIDSMQTNIFEKRVIGRIVGYFAHRFHEYFSTFYIHKKVSYEKCKRK